MQEEVHAAAFLEKGHVSRLKCATLEQLRKHSDWEPIERRGNPSARSLGRVYLSNVQEEHRRGGVSVKHVPPLVAGQLTKLVIDMRRRVVTLLSAAARTAIVRDVVILLRRIPHA